MQCQACWSGAAGAALGGPGRWVELGLTPLCPGCRPQGSPPAPCTQMRGTGRSSQRPRVLSRRATAGLHAPRCGLSSEGLDGGAIMTGTGATSHRPPWPPAEPEPWREGAACTPESTHPVSTPPGHLPTPQPCSEPALRRLNLGLRVGWPLPLGVGPLPREGRVGEPQSDSGLPGRPQAHRPRAVPHGAVASAAQEAGDNPRLICSNWFPAIPWSGLRLGSASAAPVGCQAPGSCQGQLPSWVLATGSPPAPPQAGCPR